MSDCHTCRFVGDVPGSAHRACHHPLAEKVHEYIAERPLLKLAALMGGGRMGPAKVDGMPIEFHQQGIRGGWCDWPLNFDPVWVDCKAHEEALPLTEPEYKCVECNDTGLYRGHGTRKVNDGYDADEQPCPECRPIEPEGSTGVKP